MNIANDLIITGLTGILVSLDTTPARKVVIGAVLVVVGVIAVYGFHVQ